MVLISIIFHKSIVTISLNETNSLNDINQILEILAEAEGKEPIDINTDVRRY